ncbi:hypothetical protein BDB01DRAFT_409324 [Pilobolus umbonatus]|nr:hypothetical protein BDB01DRAFT_409324 [Pilobolus umbonatus]
MSTNNINCLSKPVLNNEGINIHECPVCEDIFRTNQLLNNHMHRKHRPIVPSPDVDITMEERTEEVYSPEYFTRTSMNSESGFDNAETYDITPIDEDSFNFATLMSILLYDIVTDFKAPQKMHRRLVRLMNTLIKNIDKLGR